MLAEPSAEDREQRVDAILAAYLDAAEAGRAPDRQVLVRQHRELADELGEFFADFDQMEVLAAPLRAIRQVSSGAQATPFPSAAEVESVIDPNQTGSYQPATAAPAGRPVAADIPGYEILDVLGRGGMGVVYRARQVRLNRLVALKVIRLDRLGVPGAVERFEREVRAVGQLDHPHLVEAHDAGEYQGNLYLAMKLLDGIDLGQLVRERGPLAVAEACELLRQAALGLQYLHERGLVHRDIKPSNLMRLPSGQLKVLDLGLARWLDGLAAPAAPTEPGVILGTFEYMAPEQADNPAGTDIRADLYALGGTLFYLLTGRPPFAHHQTMTAKLKAHAVEAPPDLRTLRPEVPPPVAELVQRLLAKKPADRPETPQHLADELACFLDRPPSPLRGRGVGGEGVAPRRRIALILGGVGLCCLAVMLALLPSLLRREPAEKLTLPDLPPERSLPARIQVLRLDVSHFANQGKFQPPRGVLGQKSFRTRCDDLVTVSARLSAPAYCYLIAYRPDGTEEVCFPEDDAPPQPTDEPRYPAIDPKVRYGLDEGPGLMAFVLVVSREPLPAYKAWRKGRGDALWRHVEALPDVVWRIDGVDVKAASPHDPEDTRGAGRQIKGLEPLFDLLAWLRQEPRFETVAAVAFPVLRDK